MNNHEPASFADVIDGMQRIVDYEPSMAPYQNPPRLTAAHLAAGLAALESLGGMTPDVMFYDPTRLRAAGPGLRGGPLRWRRSRAYIVAKARRLRRRKHGWR